MCSTAEIAHAIGVSEQTVRYHCAKDDNPLGAVRVGEGPRAVWCVPVEFKDPARWREVVGPRRGRTADEQKG